MNTGYRHRRYAESLSEFGEIRELPSCGGWILEREIPGTGLRDAMGCYPIFSCARWRGLGDDLADLAKDLVSFSLVTDPFGECEQASLKELFGDVCLPFKEHYVVDLRRPVDGFVSPHHKRNAKAACRDLKIEKCDDPGAHLNEWLVLYNALIERHHIAGIPAFSGQSFAGQLAVPGIEMYRALEKDTTVGMLLWYIQDDVGYYHLGAYSLQGYENKASFALFWYVIHSFAERGLKWLNLGAGPGLQKRGSDGLSRFKEGWSTGTRKSYFCGRIFDRSAYTKIVEAKGISATDYFPAYREGEFG